MVGSKFDTYNLTAIRCSQGSEMTTIFLVDGISPFLSFLGFPHCDLPKKTPNPDSEGGKVK